MTRKISRKHFVSLLAGVPWLRFAAASSTRPGSLTISQIESVDLVLRRLVDSKAVVGISYSIGNASETLAEGAFGLRFLDPPAQMLKDTRVALASVSKQFVSAGAFLLQQAGALSLDAPLSNYLPEYIHAAEMTLAQVLTMRSGIPADDAAGESPLNGQINEGTLIANLNQQKLDFPPGRYFAYSNCAYDLAGVVISRVAKMSYARFLDENFFQPLGMNFSYPMGTRDADFAQGYAPDSNGWRPETPTIADRTFASGNLVSTPGDMQRWNRSLLNATLLSRDTLRKIFTVPTVAGPGQMHYASGWFVEPSGIIWHAGTLAGYGTNNLLIPATGHAITILSNTAPGNQWKPPETALELYNAASLGPVLPPLLPRVRTTAPSSGG